MGNFGIGTHASTPQRAFGNRRRVAPEPAAKPAARTKAEPPVAKEHTDSEAFHRNRDAIRAPAPAPGATPEAEPVTDSKNADLETFFGHNADFYMAVYEGGLVRRNWCAFFIGFVWFFYRKMYLYGSAALILPMLVALVFPFGSDIAGIATGFALRRLGNQLYIAEALRRIKKADELELSGAARKVYLRRAGGVSVAGAVIGSLIYAGLFIVAIAAIAQKQT